jgi:hypothetical protein
MILAPAPIPSSYCFADWNNGNTVCRRRNGPANARKGGGTQNRPRQWPNAPESKFAILANQSGVGLTKSKREIQAADLNELLGGLAVRASGGPDPVDTWANAEGYYPGDTKVASSELWRRFRAWHAQNCPDDLQPPTLKHFGVVMSRRFRKGRGKMGIFYYISRKKI